jgi:hypothetical protein
MNLVVLVLVLGRDACGVTGHRPSFEVAKIALSQKQSEGDTGLLYRSGGIGERPPGTTLAYSL